MYFNRILNWPFHYLFPHSFWLIVPRVCQLWICFPQNFPQDLLLAQKCAEWWKTDPDSSWGVGRHHHGLKGKSGCVCSFRKKIFFFGGGRGSQIVYKNQQTKKDVVVQQKRWMWLHPDYRQWSDASVNGNRLTATPRYGRTYWHKALCIRIDLHSVTHQNLDIGTSEPTHNCWREVGIYPSPEFAFHKTSFTHTNKTWICTWKRKS